jgi:hypothetical protein
MVIGRISSRSKDGRISKYTVWCVVTSRSWQSWEWSVARPGTAVVVVDVVTVVDDAVVLVVVVNCKE